MVGESDTVYVYLPTYFAYDYSLDAANAEECGLATLTYSSIYVSQYDMNTEETHDWSMDMTNLDGEVFTLQGDALMFYTGEEWYANNSYTIYAMLSYNGMEIHEVYVASIHVTAPVDTCESSTIVVENSEDEY